MSEHAPEQLNPLPLSESDMAISDEHVMQMRFNDLRETLQTARELNDDIVATETQLTMTELAQLKGSFLE